MLIQSLHFDHQVSIFGQWLKLVDICRFDSAACENLLRQQFLNVVKSDQVLLTELIQCESESIERSVLDKKEEQCIEWLLLRGIKMLTFGFLQQLSENRTLRHRFLEHSGAFMSTIIFWGLSNDEEIIKLYKSGANIDCVASTAEILLDIAQYCPNLTHLSAHDYVVDATLATLVLHCRRFQKLNLSRCFGISSAVLKAFCTYGTELKELILDRCFFVGGGWHNMSVRCNSLIELSLMNTNILRGQYAKLVSLFPNLQKLEATGLNSADLETICCSCPLITYCRILLVEALSSAQETQFAKAWSGIEYLDVTFHQSSRPVVSERGVLQLIRNCHRLQTLRVCHESFLYMKGEPDDSRGRFCFSSPVSHLQTLVVSSASEHLFEVVSQSCPKLSCLGIALPSTSIESSSIDSSSSSSDSDSDGDSSDDGNSDGNGGLSVAGGHATFPDVAALLAYVERMKIYCLALANCPNITTDFIRNLRGLHSIILCDLPNVDHSCLVELATNNVMLYAVAVERCANVTIEVLRQISHVCPNLWGVVFTDAETHSADPQKVHAVFEEVQEKCPQLHDFVANEQVLL